MTPETLQEIRGYQAQALQVCHNHEEESAKLRVICSKYGSPITEGILRKLAALPSSEVSFVLGEFGHQLKSFADFIDFQSPHPDLKTLFKGTLVENKGFGRDLCDLYDLIKYASKDCSSFVLDSIGKIVLQLEDYISIKMSIDSPTKNLKNLRFVSDRTIRSEIRSHKKFQSVGLRAILEDRTAWDESPADFLAFHRFGHRFRTELAEAESRLIHFKNLNLPSMALEIEKSISDLKRSSTESQYLGFNKIGIPAATLILAKLLGFHLDVSSEPAIRFQHRLYTPVAYTLEEALPYASQEMLELVAALEEFPEMADKPIFDHFRVLVPSFDHSVMVRMKSVLGENGSPIFYIETEKNPDFAMIKDGDTVGILLGEKDGEFYFISYWM